MRSQVAMRNSRKEGNNSVLGASNTLLSETADELPSDVVATFLNFFATTFHVLTKTFDRVASTDSTCQSEHAEDESESLEHKFLLFG